MKTLIINSLYFFVLGLLCTPHQLFAQNSNMWNTLSKVSLRTETKAGQTIDVPVFSEELKKWNGKEITLKGYIIPLEELKKQNYFVLSRYPFSLCYFCGGAGVETVIEVNIQKPIPFTEEAITVKGILQLNDKSPNHLIFVLNHATKIQ
jgi:hypothetical protein